jgi:hypothetical protein
MCRSGLAFVDALAGTENFHQGFRAERNGEPVSKSGRIQLCNFLRRTVMSANRVLGLMAAILVTTGQALVLARDTAAPAARPQAHFHHTSELGSSRMAYARLVYGWSRG